MNIGVELQIEERLRDRVYVSVVLRPTDEDAAVEGVAVQVVSRTGEAISPRLLLPISGTLSSTMVSTVELRGLTGTIPRGSKIVGSAWLGSEQIEFQTSADLGPTLGAHLRADHQLWPRSQGNFSMLTDQEQCELAEHLPWLDCWTKPRSVEEEDGVLEGEEDAGDPVEAFADALGLGEEDSEWLRKLLNEDDEADTP